jgi:hypothetical protein
LAIDSFHFSTPLVETNPIDGKNGNHSLKANDKRSYLEPAAESAIASTKNPLGLMASLGVPKGFMASHGAV